MSNKLGNAKTPFRRSEAFKKGLFKDGKVPLQRFCCKIPKCMLDVLSNTAWFGGNKP